MSNVVLPLAIASSSLFVGSLIMSVVMLKRIPLSICVETAVQEARPFIMVGKPPQRLQEVKCFSNIEELYEFCSGAGIKLIELRKAMGIIVALKKAMLSIAALSVLGLVISTAIVATIVSLGA